MEKTFRLTTETHTQSKTTFGIKQHSSNNSKTITNLSKIKWIQNITDNDKQCIKEDKYDIKLPNGDVPDSLIAQAVTAIKIVVMEKLSSTRCIAQRKEILNSVKLALRLIQETKNAQGSKMFNNEKLDTYYGKYDSNFYCDLINSIAPGDGVNVSETTPKQCLELICTHLKGGDNKTSLWGPNFTTTAEELIAWLTYKVVPAQYEGKENNEVIPISKNPSHTNIERNKEPQLSTMATVQEKTINQLKQSLETLQQEKENLQQEKENLQQEKENLQQEKESLAKKLNYFEKANETLTEKITQMLELTTDMSQNITEVVEPNSRKNSWYEVEDKAQNLESSWDEIKKKEPNFEKCTPKIKSICEALSSMDLDLNTDTTAVDLSDITWILSNEQENQYLAEIKRLFAAAEQFVILSSLSPPTRILEAGKLAAETYYATFVNSLSAIAGKNQNGRIRSNYIKVRLIFGNAPSILGTGVELDTQKYLTQLLDDIPEKLREYLILEIAAYNPINASWNHSKIIVVDDKQVNVGGINLFEEYNDSGQRVRDLASTVKSRQLAITAHKYLNALATAPATHFIQINSLNKHLPYYNPKSKWDGAKITSAPQDKAYEILDIPPLSEETNAIAANDRKHNVLSVPTLGKSRTSKQESEIVALNIIASASKSLKISQQSILFMLGKIVDKVAGGYSQEIISALQNALQNKVKIDIVISPDKSKAKNDASYDGMPIANLYLALDKERKFEKLLTIRNTNDSTGKAVPNHSKVVIVDDELASLGSHNSYDNSHAEYTVVYADHGDQKIVANLIEKFWNPLISIPDQAAELIKQKYYTGK